MPQLGDIGAGTDLLTTGAIPVGSMLPFAGQTAPTGWTMCNGVEVLRSSPLGTWLAGRFGSGNGSTTYNVPDMRDRLPIGKAESGTASTLGSTGGSLNHSHAVGSYDMPSHDHQNSSLVLPAHSHGHSISFGSHSHSLPVTSAYTITDTNDFAGSAVQGGTFANTPGVSGGVSNSAATGMSSGRSAAATPGLTGTSGNAEVPYQTVNYIIKN